jgi:hypothetical protein
VPHGEAGCRQATFAGERSTANCFGGSAVAAARKIRGYEVRKDRFNPVSFDPVETTAIRVEVRLQPGFSGGILEWRVD